MADPLIKPVHRPPLWMPPFPPEATQFRTDIWEGEPEMVEESTPSAPSPAPAWFDSNLHD